MIVINSVGWDSQRKLCVVNLNFRAESFEEAKVALDLIKSAQANEPVFDQACVIDEWIDTGKLAGLPYMPCSSQGVLRKAKKQNWLIRTKPNCSKWTQIHISNLSPETVKALRRENL